MRFTSSLMDSYIKLQRPMYNIDRGLATSRAAFSGLLPTSQNYNKFFNQQIFFKKNKEKLQKL